MKRNSSGKVVTIFLVIVAILLVSLTAISIFIFQKEKEKRIEVEVNLKKNREDVIAFKAEIREIKRKNFLLQEKNKEVDEQINSLLDELELEKGLREELKQANVKLKEKTENMEELNKELEGKLTSNLEKSKEKISELEDKLKMEIAKIKELKKLNEEFKSKNIKLEEEVKIAEENKVELEKAEEQVFTETESFSEEAVEDLSADESVELAPIVVSPIELREQKAIRISRIEKKVSVPEVMMKSVGDLPNGKILSVDRETEFVIINIGKKHGIGVGQMMAVYREGEYLGDIKITRIQSQMSAADLISPLSSRIVQKNDQVMAK